ncbi:alpha/beta hydrolase family protein [Paracoccus litorisediminis]|uniref:Alpha/beta fold hydrolase n=1 Tax=Paracoccus litorisediminis TaxID=2006130 RepID=A0A844HQY9_9RHOB|nr:alpha/beta fold hydrolase [Paracoccus litorisediminis]MTH60012.1 alpha/beta fold hydrolase [Paracoccus litorisediminis]
MTLRLAALGLAALSATMAVAGEKTVTVERADKRIAGILTLPEGAENPPVVLMLHGFTGSKNEFTVAGTQTGLFTLMAEELAKAGIASLRIDFAGSGESSGKWANTTFSGQIADAVDAFDYLQALPGVDGHRIGILGYSQGGLVGAHLAAARPETRAAVLWAPVANPMATYATIMGADKVAEGLAATSDHAVTADLSWGGQTTLNGAFFHELPETSAAAALASYPGPLRVIAGRNETIVAPQPYAAQQLLRYHAGAEDLVLLESDHDFGAGTSDALVRAELAPRTVGWFRDNL